MTLYKGYYQSPIGLMEIKATKEQIASVLFVSQRSKEEDGEESELIIDCREQLDAYFYKRHLKFSIPLLLKGTPFQEDVINRVSHIPYGETASYSDLAFDLGRPKSVRAVGGAVGQNQLAIIIPCHRVVGKAGQMTGYAWGIERKRWLLEHERRK